MKAIDVVYNKMAPTWTSKRLWGPRPAMHHRHNPNGTVLGPGGDGARGDRHLAARCPCMKPGRCTVVGQNGFTYAHAHASSRDISYCAVTRPCLSRSLAFSPFGTCSRPVSPSSLATTRTHPAPPATKQLIATTPLQLTLTLNWIALWRRFARSLEPNQEQCKLGRNWRGCGRGVTRRRYLWAVTVMLMAVIWGLSVSLSSCEGGYTKACRQLRIPCRCLHRHGSFLTAFDRFVRGEGVALELWHLK